MKKVKTLKNDQKHPKIDFSDLGGKSECGIFFLYGCISSNAIFMAISKFLDLVDFTNFAIFA